VWRYLLSLSLLCSPSVILSSSSSFLVLKFGRHGPGY
jgi:hypothetical protein